MTLTFTPPPTYRGELANFPGTGVYLFGGLTTAENPTNSFQNTVYRWSGSAWSIVNTTGGPPSARFDHGMAYDGYNLIMVGGTDATGNLLSDTWALSSGNAWSFQTYPLSGTVWPYLAPTTIRRMAMSYANTSGANTILLFGGEARQFGNRPSIETWQWTHGVGWAQLSPTTNPVAVVDAAMASNTAGTTTLLTGGWTYDGPSKKSWTFSSGNWTQVADMPVALSGHQMVFDQVANVWIVFGGKKLDGTLNGQTYTFNGTIWSTPAIATQPPARMYHQMTFDSTNGNTILFSGIGQQSQGQILSDTWTFNGGTLIWTAL